MRLIKFPVPPPNIIDMPILIQIFFLFLIKIKDNIKSIQIVKKDNKICIQKLLPEKKLKVIPVLNVKKKNKKIFDHRM